MSPRRDANNSVGMGETTSKVGVVDDDRAVLESFQFMLELAGFAVLTYDSAVAYLAGDGARPSCLILDQHMPYMTGLELAAALQSSGLRDTDHADNHRPVAGPDRTRGWFW